MSETKHTPGPWELDDENCVYGGGSRIASVCPPVDCIGGIDVAKWDNNACLILAAPDMLDALQAVLDFVEGKQCAQKPFGLVRSAIRKATGG